MLITINGDACAIIDAERDFRYFVEKYMGFEAREVYDSIIENKYVELCSLDNYVHSLEEEISTMTDELDCLETELYAE